MLKIAQRNPKPLMLEERIDAAHAKAAAALSVAAQVADDLDEAADEFGKAQDLAEAAVDNYQWLADSAEQASCDARVQATALRALNESE